MDRDDAHELAQLRERAYGPHARGLSAADLTRLDELEGRLAAGPEEGRAQAHAPGDGARPEPPTSSEAPAPPRAAGETAARERHIVGARLAMVVLAVLIPIAALGGYFLAPRMPAAAAPVAPAVPLLLSGEYESTWSDTRAEVETMRDWDGAVSLLGASGDMAVWWGVSGGDTCVVIYAATAQLSQACDATDEVRERGLQLSVGSYILDSGEDEVAADDASAGREITVQFVGNPYTGRFMLSRSGGAE